MFCFWNGNYFLPKIKANNRNPCLSKKHKLNKRNQKARNWWLLSLSFYCSLLSAWGNKLKEHKTLQGPRIPLTVRKMTNNVQDACGGWPLMYVCSTWKDLLMLLPNVRVLCSMRWVRWKKIKPAGRHLNIPDLYILSDHSHAAQRLWVCGQYVSTRLYTNTQWSINRTVSVFCPLFGPLAMV